MARGVTGRLGCRELRGYPQSSCKRRGHGLTLAWIKSIKSRTLRCFREMLPPGYVPASGNSTHGRTRPGHGIELQYEETLTGQRGGLLAAVSPEGVITATIAETPSEPGRDIWLTIDINVQKQAEGQLGEKVGAVVVMDPRDNSVVAMGEIRHVSSSKSCSPPGTRTDPSGATR